MASSTPALAELDFNLCSRRHGHLTLAHTERSVRVQRERAEMNQALGVDSRLIVERDEIAKLCPRAEHVERRAVSDPGRALPPAGRGRCATTRWCGATRAGAAKRGVHIHQGVRGHGHPARTRNGRRASASTPTAGRSTRARDVCAVAGWTTRSPTWRASQTPITNHPLQAFVTEPVKPMLQQDRRLGRTCTCTSRRPTAASS